MAVAYMPNVIMASAFAMLFFTLFSDGGPINSMLMQAGLITEPYKFYLEEGTNEVTIKTNKSEELELVGFELR